MKPSLVEGSTDLPLLDITIGQALENAAGRWGGEEALVVSHQDIRWTWSQPALVPIISSRSWLAQAAVWAAAASRCR